MRNPFWLSVILFQGCQEKEEPVKEKVQPPSVQVEQTIEKNTEKKVAEANEDIGRWRRARKCATSARRSPPAERRDAGASRPATGTTTPRT